MLLLEKITNTNYGGATAREKERDERHPNMALRLINWLPQLQLLQLGHCRFLFFFVHIFLSAETNTVNHLFVRMNSRESILFQTNGIDANRQRRATGECEIRRRTKQVTYNKFIS